MENIHVRTHYSHLLSSLQVSYGNKFIKIKFYEPANSNLTKVQNIN